jgi:5-methylcytosine-specific restriction enzyme A
METANPNYVLHSRIVTMRSRGRASVPVVKPLVPLAPRRVPLPPKKAEPFYLSPEWRKFIVMLVLKRGRRCEKCGAFRNDHGEPVRLFGDHIIELKHGGAPLDENNVKILCGKCHSAKTIQVRTRQSRAR